MLFATGLFFRFFQNGFILQIGHLDGLERYLYIGKGIHLLIDVDSDIPLLESIDFWLQCCEILRKTLDGRNRIGCRCFAAKRVSWLRAGESHFLHRFLESLEFCRQKGPENEDLLVIHTFYIELESHASLIVRGQ